MRSPAEATCIGDLDSRIFIGNSAEAEVPRGTSVFGSLGHRLRRVHFRTLYLKQCLYSSIISAQQWQASYLVAQWLRLFAFVSFGSKLSSFLFMWTYPQTFDVIVIGAGHAGIEASAAAARLGCDTLLLTQNLDTIGQMSCNPAIGGLAKGHMVREIDALGGMMAENSDATGIQFRMLNANKGPSVRAPRAQCDKKAYQFRMKALLEQQAGLDVKQGGVVKVLAARETAGWVS